MNMISVCTVTITKRRFKVYIWGQPDLHMMDWNGCNYRTMTVKGQPHRGFASREEAEAWALDRFPTDADATVYASEGGDGTFMSNSRYEELNLKDIRLPKGDLKKAWAQHRKARAESIPKTE